MDDAVMDLDMRYKARREKEVRTVCRETKCEYIIISLVLSSMYLVYSYEMYPWMYTYFAFVRTHTAYFCTCLLPV